jgi:hypothetical protein
VQRGNYRNARGNQPFPRRTIKKEGNEKKDTPVHFAKEELVT